MYSFSINYNYPKIHPSFCIHHKNLLLLTNIPWYGYTTVCLTIHPLKDIWKHTLIFKWSKFVNSDTDQISSIKKDLSLLEENMPYLVTI